jgi:hypothetical protein
MRECNDIKSVRVKALEMIDLTLYNSLSFSAPRSLEIPSRGKDGK